MPSSRQARVINSRQGTKLSFLWYSTAQRRELFIYSSCMYLLNTYHPFAPVLRSEKRQMKNTCGMNELINIHFTKSRVIPEDRSSTQDIWPLCVTSVMCYLFYIMFF